jgi:hypothetical protein
VAKIDSGSDEDGLRIIISCNCDTCVFGDDWKEAAAAGDLYVVIDPDGVNNMIKMIAKYMEGKK